MGVLAEDERKLGEHRLASETIGIPPETDAIAEIQASRAYKDWDAVNEARNFGLLRPSIDHAELSPTFGCPEDCGGCPDRISLHLDDPEEVQIDAPQWYEKVDRLKEMGVKYFLLIGGTIDRHPVTPKLMSYILDKEPPVDVGWFTDGIMLQNSTNGKPTKLAERLIRDGRMKELTTHVSADFLVLQGVEADGPILDPAHRWENEFGGSRWYKSAYGERLARSLVQAGARRVILNTAISAHNLDQVIPVYDYVVELQDYARDIDSPTVVLHTVSPWIWRPHLARGDDPRNYDAATLLQENHKPQLAETASYIISDTRRRLVEGLSRVAGNSSGFIQGLPTFAITQNIPYLFDSGELAVQPDGTVRMDPVFISARMLQHAFNPYGYRDRDIYHNPFEVFNEDGNTFPNLVQTTRGEIPWK